MVCTLTRLPERRNILHRKQIKYFKKFFKNDCAVFRAVFHKKQTPYNAYTPRRCKVSEWWNKFVQIQILSITRGGLKQ